MYTTLIDVSDLVELLPAGDCVVLDCRFSLTDTEAGLQQFRQAHIPGAQYAHMEHDLSSPIIKNKSSRHPLPTADTFVQCLRRWGINNDTQVIAYDDMGGAMAARAWWLCRWTGHEACAVLNGGITKWRNQDLPLSSEFHTPVAGNASARAALATVVVADDVLSDNRLLIDARAPERYTGRTEPLDRIAGHIPGAVNSPFAQNLNTSGEFSSIAELRQRFQSICSSKPATKVTHYCGSGVTGAHNVLAMLHAGLGMTDLYAGSWSEWVQDDSRPVATGND